MEYEFGRIERKWQDYWAHNQSFKADNHSDQPKYYVLDMFPYPSGAGLHVGHPLGYIASDIVARYKRHCGFNVLHPMGYDSFGLPAEQYAIQTGQHPEITTRQNILRYREQLDQMGFSFDWSRQVETSNPKFYRWTQWMFLQLFDSWYDTVRQVARPIAELTAHWARHGSEGIAPAGAEELTFGASEWEHWTAEQREDVLQKVRLAYRAESTVNWCPALGTVLANDEVKDGLSERGGHPVVQKKMMQWSLRITAYAERLLRGLEEIDWPEPLKEAQRNWIGRSEGARLHFAVKDHPEKIEIFTTRPDTIFGANFMVLAPEHPLVEQITTPDQAEAVKQYQEAATRKSERERLAEVKSITGAFTGALALHPFTGKEMPVWIADYVLAGYGTGAIMAVPAHDSRDWAFAGTFDLPRPEVVAGGRIDEEAFEAKEGPLINSDFLDGLEVPQAIARAIEEIEKNGIGRGTVNYRLRDAVFGRQRYWGEPIPVFYEKGLPRPVRPEHLPLELPAVDKYLPTEAGDPPLERSEKWHYHPEKGVVKSGEGHPLETTTMPGWAGSSWYDLRYMDPHNEEAFVSSEAEQYWQSVDLYIGGSEHATGHLLYTRFWHKFLKDRGWISADEPFKKLINQGMILGNSALVHRVKGERKFLSRNLVKGRETIALHADVNMVSTGDELDLEAFKNWREDWVDADFEKEEGKFLVNREVEKMSKSKYNVVNPDDIIRDYGADTLRMYEMFLGPLEQAKPWNTAGITGVHNFLKKFWRLFYREGKCLVEDHKPTAEELKALHQLLKKVREDIENYSFNTAVSAFMICVNELTALHCHKRAVLEKLTVALSPFAPHVAEELWSTALGNKPGIGREAFPRHEEAYLIEDSVQYPVAFNGKTRFTVELPAGADRKAIEKEVLALEKTQHYLEGKPPRKVIVVPGKIVNIVKG